MSRHRVAIDIGGTFTDLVSFDQLTGSVRHAKISTTPGDLARAIVEVLDRATEDTRDVEFFVHGTTAGLNAFLERRGAPVGLITTRGFRDVYEIGRANRPDMYNLHYRKPTPLVPRRHIYEVPERILFDGSVEEPLDETALIEIVKKIRGNGIDTVAVCFLHSYVNPEHELRAASLIREFAPELHVSLSHRIAREWREYERTSTTVINAYVAPIIDAYLTDLETRLKDRMGVPLHVMQSNGGIMTSEVARDKPFQTLFSGPVGGAVGVATVGRSLGIRNLIGIDMGGTSFDVSLVTDGALEQATQLSLEGHPILTPMVKIHTIGAGGGSLVWLEGGGLRVGPRSAGAVPGPVCYSRGGEQPTVTDANVVLGRIDPQNFLGGEMRLDADAAHAALQRVGSDLGLDAETLAEGVCRIANARMAEAIRSITVDQGIDPREFALLAFGGAGPLHAVFLAEELEIKRVIVPPAPGTFSAGGMLQTNIQHNVAQTLYRRADDDIASDVCATFEALEKQARTILQHDGVAMENMRMLYSAEMRYVGQEYAVQVAFPNNEFDAEALKQMPDLFHTAHNTRYGHSNPAEVVEYVNLRITATGIIDKPAPGRYEMVRDSETPSFKLRNVVFNGELHQTRVYDRALLQHGHSVEGPAIVEEPSATTVIPPGHRLNVDEFNNLDIS
jgi:N-methylhydantoinase A